MAVTLDLAISAIRAGRKTEGRKLLNLLIQQNPNNAMAWLWMSSVVDTDEQRTRCLNHVLSIEPENKLAQRGLQLLGVKDSETPEVAVKPAPQPKPHRPSLIVNPPSPQVAVKPGSQPKPANKPVASNNGKLKTEAQPEKPVPAKAEVAPAAAKSEPKPATPAQPEAPKPETADKPRTPFLIDPATVTDELPFTPLRAPFTTTERIQASPAILSIDVEKAEPADSAPKNSEPVAAQQPKPEQAVEAVVQSESLPPQKTTVQTASSDSAAVSQENAALPQPAAKEGEAVKPATVNQAALSAAAASAAISGQETQQLPDLAAASAPEATSATPPMVNGTSPDARHSETGSLAAAQPAPAAESGPLAPPAARNTPFSDQPAAVTGQPQGQEAPEPGSRPVSPPPTESRPYQPQYPPNGAPGQTPAIGAYPPNPPLETRPAQPILVNYPQPNSNILPGYQGQFYGGQPYSGHSDGTVPMSGSPYNQGGPSAHAAPPGHTPPNMGMPPPQNEYYRPPSEPVPVSHPTHAMSLVPYGYHFQQQPPGMGLHSNATVLMPNLSEAEIRARLATNQAIPTANAAAMPLQNASGWPGVQPWYGPRPEPHDYHGEQEEEGGEINILAVIIFGTLSITALGGLGMLILLILTTSPPAG